MAAPNPLAQAKRQAVIDHILAATRTLVLQHGLDATMDQLAEAGGVSRRTLFRHFETREKLLAAAFEAGITGYRSQLPGYPSFDGDVLAWLRATCESAHRMNSTIGPGFFELASRTDLPADLEAAEARRRQEFRGAMADITETLWHALDGAGDPPESLRTTITAHLSPHFTAALTIDAAQGWAAAADLAHRAITAELPPGMVR
ncbi:MAG: helix-turn-helix domain-containing protein [Mycobacterium sp.]